MNTKPQLPQQLGFFKAFVLDLAPCCVSPPPGRCQWWEARPLQASDGHAEVTSPWGVEFEWALPRGLCRRVRLSKVLIPCPVSKQNTQNKPPVDGVGPSPNPSGSLIAPQSRKTRRVAWKELSPSRYLFRSQVPSPGHGGECGGWGGSFRPSRVGAKLLRSRAVAAVRSTRPAPGTPRPEGWGGGATLTGTRSAQKSRWTLSL